MKEVSRRGDLGWPYTAHFRPLWTGSDHGSYCDRLRALLAYLAVEAGREHSR
jgi:hypothetical protein